jgi:hypothetical protein
MEKGERFDEALDEVGTVIPPAQVREFVRKHVT